MLKQAEGVDVAFDSPIDHGVGDRSNGADGRRRTLIVTYLFPPDLAIGAHSCAQIGRYLPRYGWEAVVLTVRERHIEYADQGSGLAFPGPIVRAGIIPHPFILYRRLKSAFRPGSKQSSGDDGWPGMPLSRWRRWAVSALNPLGVPDLYTGWIVPAVVAGLAAIRKHAVDHIFSSAPPWTSHLVGLILARLSGLPWTAHFRDPWTDPWSETHRSRPVTALSAWIERTLERMVVERASAVVCVTEEHTALLRRAHRTLPAAKFVTIPNGFDGAEWDQVTADRPGSGEAFVITYAGSLYDRRDPRPVLRALRRLMDAGQVDPQRVRVDLIGWCDVASERRVTDIATEYGLNECVRVTEPLSRTEALRRIARSNLLLLLAEGLSLQVPGKTYEYLRAGRPILALTGEGAVARLLRKTGGAWIAEPGDETTIATSLREAYRRWAAGQEGPSADRAVVMGFDRRRLAGDFARLFETAITGRAALRMVDGGGRRV